MFVQFALGAWPLSMRLFMHSNAELFIHMNYYCCLLFYYIKLIIKFIMLNEMYYIEWCAQAHGMFTKARARARTRLWFTCSSCCSIVCAQNE